MGFALISPVANNFPVFAPVRRDATSPASRRFFMWKSVPLGSGLLRARTKCHPQAENDRDNHPDDHRQPTRHFMLRALRRPSGSAPGSDTSRAPDPRQVSLSPGVPLVRHRQLTRFLAGSGGAPGDRRGGGTCSRGIESVRPASRSGRGADWRDSEPRARQSRDESRAGAFLRNASPPHMKGRPRP